MACVPVKSLDSFSNPEVNASSRKGALNEKEAQTNILDEEVCLTSEFTKTEINETVDKDERPKHEERELVDKPRRTKLSFTLPGQRDNFVENKLPIMEISNTDKPVGKLKNKKKKKVMLLCDRKIRLLETESYTKERLEEYMKKRSDFALQIGELQAKVMAFKRKNNPTDEDIVNLKKHHIHFLEKMSEFEKFTQKVKHFMTMVEVPPTQKADFPRVSVKPSFQEPNMVMAPTEDKLPGIIVSGTVQRKLMTHLDVSETLKSHVKPFNNYEQSDVRPDVSDRTITIDETKEKIEKAHETQEKLATEQSKIDQIWLKMQQELLTKQEILGNMKEKLLSYESENLRLQNENAELHRKLIISEQGLNEIKIYKQDLYKEKSPADAHSLCSDNTPTLELKSKKMDSCHEQNCLDTKNICPDKSTVDIKHVSNLELLQKSTQTDEDKMQDVYFMTDTDPKNIELMEQYHKLHTDFKHKDDEVATLKFDLEKMRTDLNKITMLYHELKAMRQKELKNNCDISKVQIKVQSPTESLLDVQQETNCVIQMYNNSHEELADLKTLITDLATQLDEYRNKYMKTLQIAEELKKENDFLEIEYANKNAVEIQKMKLEMHDYLKELVPIKELLKIKQQKLKETEQIHTTTLETVAQLSQKLEITSKELEMAHLQIDKSGIGNSGIEELKLKLEIAEQKLKKHENENQKLKEIIAQLEQLKLEQNKLLEEKCNEIKVLTSQLGTMRKESEKQLYQLKGQNEMIRKCMQTRIADMEREVVMSRTEMSCANKERDRIQSKLQLKICVLSENFRESQNQIRQLQQRISYLSASHPISLIELYKESL